MTVVLALCFVPHRAAAGDGSIDRGHLSHVTWLDRTPTCPMAGESFEARVRALHGDLTSVRFWLSDGGTSAIDATILERRGPYDIWSASIPATVSGYPSYYIEVHDGAVLAYLSASGITDTPPVDGGFALNFTSLSHAPLGATPVHPSGAVFRVWAPSASSAALRGQFNAWDLSAPMTRLGNDYVTWNPNAIAGQQYKYFFNGSLWQTDARARAVNPVEFMNGVIENPDGYAWQVQDFQTPAPQDLVIYQLNVDTFAGRNDPFGSAPFPSRFVDVAARASHLAELGVNAVMLNPVIQWCDSVYAGYTPMAVWAVDARYGTPDQLKAMIDTFHQHGIAVLLDLVWNHFACDLLENYDGTQIYFATPAVQTPWGPQADFNRAEVQDLFIHSAYMWLDEYRADGFRMDAARELVNSQVQGWSLARRLNDDVDRRWKDKFILAESGPIPALTDPSSSGGGGFDAQYHFAFGSQVRQAMLAADPSMASVASALAGDGAYDYGQKGLNFLELHDEVWTNGRMVTQLDPSAPHDDSSAQAMLRLGQGLAMLSPGIPAMLMGSEWLEDTSFGSSSATYRIDWSKETTYAPFYQYMRDLIALRRSDGMLRAGVPHHVFHLDEASNVIAFERTDGTGGHTVVIANFGAADQHALRLGLPSSAGWREALNSQDLPYGGTGLTNPGMIVPTAVPADGFPQSAALELPARSVVVLRPAAALSAPASAADASEPLRIVSAGPNPSAGAVTLVFAQGRPSTARVRVFDLHGRTVASLLDSPRQAGRHTVVWDGHGSDGAPVSPGIYLLRVDSAGASVSRPVAIVH